jgi:hypothetical protein
MHPSNFYIGSQTRKYLIEEFGTTGSDFDKIERVLVATRKTSPGGMVYDVSISAGASVEVAVAAGVSAELFYGAGAITDDIQDGEAEYVSPSLAYQVNAQAMLVCASYASLSRLSASHVFGKAGVHMLMGQAIDLQLKDNPNLPVDIETYAEMNTKFAGAAFSAYMWLPVQAVRLSTICRNYTSQDWLDFGHALGLLLNACADEESQDSRWTRINVIDRVKYLKEVREKFNNAAEKMPQLEILGWMIRSNLERVHSALSGLTDGTVT